jgi:HEAT repeat protein
MPRKTNKTTTEKKHTAVPKQMPAPKPAVSEAIVAKPQAAEATTAKPTPAPTPAPSAAVTAAIAALSDFDADIARDAATSLGNLGDSSAVKPLIEVVQNPNNYFHSVVRAAAANSLGQLKDRRAADALLRAIHDPVAEPSAAAIHALAQISEPQALAAFKEVIRNHDGFFLSFVRRAAVLGLAQLGGEGAKAELTRVASDPTEDAVIRETAEEATRSL